MSVIKKRIQKGKFSKYYYYYSGKRDHTGIQKCLYVTRLEDAKRIQLELDLHYANIKLGLVSAVTDINLSDAINHWDKIIQSKKHKDTNAFKRSQNSWYKKQIRHVNYFETWAGNILVRKITTSHVLDYKTHLLLKYASKTARDYLLTLNEFFEYCKIKSYLTKHPYDNTGKSFYPSKKPTNPRRPVKIKDIKWAIKNADNETDKIFWSLMLYTNLRKVDAGTLTLNSIKQGVITNKTKTPIPILLPKEFRSTPEKAVMVMPLEKDQRKSLARYQKLMKKRGYKTDFHAIRHSVATYLAQCGYSAADVMRITGHSSTAVRGYIHNGEHELSDLLDKIAV